jgi:phosphate transport system substrate-binding protein
MNKIIVAFGALILFFGCDNKSKVAIDTPTTGKITILADECYKPILDTEIMVFESQYKNAKINVIYRPALDVVKEIYNDSFRILLSSIVPDSNSLKKYKDVKGYEAKTTILAKDAVAVIVNNDKKGLKLTLSDLKKILNGQISDFSQIKGSGKTGKINIVFDNQKSSTVVYMQDSILKGDKLSTNVYAQNTNEEVMKYVKNNSNALGVIGVSWISDEADEMAQEFSKDISMVEIGKDNDVYFYKPNMGYIAIHKYPLRRLMQSTLREGGPGLGRGFVNFMTSEIGQKIILKSGLVPATVLTRVVEVQ